MPRRRYRFRRIRQYRVEKGQMENEDLYLDVIFIRNQILVVANYSELIVRKVCRGVRSIAVSRSRFKFQDVFYRDTSRERGRPIRSRDIDGQPYRICVHLPFGSLNNNLSFEVICYSGV